MLVDKNPRFPVLYRCEAVMGMMIFEPEGDVYVCLESVGNKELSIGSYYPSWSLNEDSYRKWTSRNVLNIDNCKTCKTRFICAGGCSMYCISNQCESECMPFLQEIDIAWQHFAKTQPELFIETEKLS